MSATRRRRPHAVEVARPASLCTSFDVASARCACRTACARVGLALECWREHEARVLAQAHYPLPSESPACLAASATDLAASLVASQAWPASPAPRPLVAAWDADPTPVVMRLRWFIAPKANCDIARPRVSCASTAARSLPRRFTSIDGVAMPSPKEPRFPRHLDRNHLPEPEWSFANAKIGLYAPESKPDFPP